MLAGVPFPKLGLPQLAAESTGQPLRNPVPHPV